MEKDIVSQWSVERDPEKANAKIFAAKPSKTLKVWTESYQWANERCVILHKTEERSVKTYHISPAGAAPVSPKTVEDVQTKRSLKSWTSFDDYKEAARAFWTVKVIGDAWEDSVCSCPVFQKQFICKHSLGMAIRLKYIRAPDEAKTVPIGRKRKRGRPSKARPALILR